MLNTQGLNMEENIINYINQCIYIKNMHQNFQRFIRFIFKNKFIENCEIKAYKFGENCKADIVICANNNKKYISIKTGKNNSVHQEHLLSFVNYLKKLGISEDSIKTYKLFHYNDGSEDGSGSNRKSAIEFIEKNKNSISALNIELNRENIKSALIKRALFIGETFHTPKVDYIYYGNIEKGLWASNEEISSFLINEATTTESVHISKLYIQSLHRNLHKYYSCEFRRNYIQIKWHSIEKDLLKISALRKKE